MELLVIRHAIAEDKAAFAKTRAPGHRAAAHEARPHDHEARREGTSSRGEIDRRARREPARARGSRRRRSSRRNTARCYVETVPALAPERAPSAFATWLRTQRDADVVAIVGHEPHLGTLITWLMSGATRSHVELEKGGACLLELSGKLGARSATLCWALTPEVLTKLSGK